MIFRILTLFPGILESYFGSSVMARAVDRGIIAYELIDIRDFAVDKHRTCDDYPYGGGAGMVLKPEPLSAAIESVKKKDQRIIYPTPSGRVFTQKYAELLTKNDDILIICGRYEGIDQRIIDEYVDDEISIGDYVLSSGEVSAMVIVDSVYRLLEGVINDESLSEESFLNDLLEYPHYTRPASFRNRDVPEILLSGHHAKINKWRFEKSLEKTKKMRPDIIESCNFRKEGNEEIKRNY